MSFFAKDRRERTGSQYNSQVYLGIMAINKHPFTRSGKAVVSLLEIGGCAAAAAHGGAAAPPPPNSDTTGKANREFVINAIGATGLSESPLQKTESL